MSRGVDTMNIMNTLSTIKFDDRGLVPVITQDFENKEVLMLAYMNKEALQKTIETGKAYYYSRSRNCLWLKGEISGNMQTVKEIRYDCDEDTLLLLVEQKGAACHTGHRSCFFKTIEDEPVSPKLFDEREMYGSKRLIELYNVILARRENPIEGSYTNYLFDKGIDKILKKVGEESAEVIIASKNDTKDELVYEISDLIYHLSVLMVSTDVTWQDIFTELGNRAGK